MKNLSELLPSGEIAFPPPIQIYHRNVLFPWLMSKNTCRNCWRTFKRLCNIQSNSRRCPSNSCALTARYFKMKRKTVCTREDPPRAAGLLEIITDLKFKWEGIYRKQNAAMRELSELPIEAQVEFFIAHIQWQCNANGDPTELGTRIRRTGGTAALSDSMRYYFNENK